MDCQKVLRFQIAEGVDEVAGEAVVVDTLVEAIGTGEKEMGRTAGVEGASLHDTAGLNEGAGLHWELTKSWSFNAPPGTCQFSPTTMTWWERIM